VQVRQSSNCLNFATWWLPGLDDHNRGLIRPKGGGAMKIIIPGSPSHKEAIVVSPD